MAPNLPRREPPQKHLVILILIFTSRESSCHIYVTIETVYSNPSWYELDTCPREEQSHCSTMSSRKHPSEGLKNNPGCLLPARQQGRACKPRGLAQREPVSSWMGSSGTSLWGTRLSSPLHFCPFSTSCFQPLAWLWGQP